MTNLHYIADEKSGGVEREYERDLMYCDEPPYNKPFLIKTGNVRIDGTIYRTSKRKADVGECVIWYNNGQMNGVISQVTEVDDRGVKFAEYNDGDLGGTYGYTHEGYRVIDPVEPSDDLTLTEADVRNNPRQVIDLIANLALRLSKLESKVSRLGTANQKAYDIVSRNVETWAQEVETIKARMGDAGRALTAEERREL